MSDAPTPTRHSPRVLVIQNDPGSTLGRFADWFAEDGLEVDLRAGADGLPESLDGYDALVMLGGPLMPDADSRAPWLEQERDLAARAISDDLPTLGICLGGQLLAHVAGGEVREKHGPVERGATQLRRLEAAADDALLAGLPVSFHVIENHRDAITRLPADAVPLVGGAAWPHQAFRLGRHVWGLQFHPEASAANIRRWNVDSLERDGIDPATALAAAEAVEPESRAACRRMARNFARTVTKAPRPARQAG